MNLPKTHPKKVRCCNTAPNLPFWPKTACFALYLTNQQNRGCLEIFCSADASPFTRASRALKRNRLGLRLALFARFARFGGKSARLMPRTFRALRALWKGIGSADASPLSRASRALEGNRLGLRLASFARFARFGFAISVDCMRTNQKFG